MCTCGWGSRHCNTACVLQVEIGFNEQTIIEASFNALLDNMYQRKAEKTTQNLIQRK
jgi:hypothetical protein